MVPYAVDLVYFDDLAAKVSIFALRPDETIPRWTGMMELDRASFFVSTETQYCMA